ncbi:DNA break repair nuclease [Mortierella sp. AD011]|nr:DNA break repair nuclease [Mortierella sp. AD010]KAF9401613.1 DNA break repair nuclease [Mortierella sp. AD011]
MDQKQRKHDLIDESHNVRDKPNPRKKQTISLRRPRVCNSSDPLFDPTTGAATEPVSISVSQQDVAQHNRLSKYFTDSETCIIPTKSSEPQELLSVPDCEDQNERNVQENDHSETDGTSNAFFAEAAERICHSSITSGTADDTAEAEQTDGCVNGCYEGPSALKDVEHGRTKAVEKSSNSVLCQQPQADPYSDSIHDLNPDAELDEGIERGEFPDIDEIQDCDLDDFQEGTESTLNADPVPENACPICGLDLSALDTMTPDAHVNRCLDGGTSDTAITIPTTLAQPSTTSTAVQASSGNPLTTIIGTIRSTVSIFSTSSGESNVVSIAKTPQEKKFKPKASKPCPFYKKLPDTSFTVDAFCYGAVDGCDVYFLSHFHSDHYGGLTSSWNHGPIYCSSITANLVISRLKVDPQYVKRLPMYEPTIVNGVTVRLMDANHCPGSVLFVFDLQNPRRRYLHTGDFRACREMVLHPVLRQPSNTPIDILYLDTTYINPRYTFPSQDLVIKEVANLVSREVGIQDSQSPASTVVQATKKVNIMEKWLIKKTGNSEKLMTMSIRAEQNIKTKQKWQNPVEKNRIVICVGTYLIGKERVFMAIAKAIKSKVFVQHSKLQILSCLEDPELSEMLTSNRLEAQVHLVHMGSEMSPESLQDYLDSLSPTFTRLIAIRPTGWTFTGGTKKYTPGNGGSVNGDDQIQATPTPTALELKPSFTSSTIKIYPVPYSEHSSFNELAGFVRSLDIVKIIPTVGVGSEKGRHAMNQWFRRWENERGQGIGWE